MLISEQIKKSHTFHNKIGHKLNKFQYQSSLKNNISAAYFDISMEHHISIVTLINNSLYGSAFSLVRPLYETYMRFLFLQTIDSENDIKKISKGTFKFPTMEDMTILIDKEYNTDNFFNELKSKSWKHMNSYTHSGDLQLGRRFTNDYIKPNYSNEEILEVLNNIDTLLSLFKIGFFKLLESKNT